MVFLNSLPLGHFGLHSILGFRCHSKFCILAQEGCRDYSDTPTDPNTHIYIKLTSNIYLKMLIWPKNGFWLDAVHNFFMIFRHFCIGCRKVVETIPIQQNVPDSRIYVQLMKQHIP